MQLLGEGIPALFSIERAIGTIHVAPRRFLQPIEEILRNHRGEGMEYPLVSYLLETYRGLSQTACAGMAQVAIRHLGLSVV